jgi:hypothetical protein
MRGIERDVVPVFKGIVMEAARALVVGDFRYAGTPEWSGNAAANWWPSVSGPVGTFVEYFHDPKYPGPPSEYNGTNNQRGAATEMSLARVKLFLDELTGIPTTVYVTNTAPYLQEYRPYGTDANGPAFRLENLYPLSAARAVIGMNQRIANASDQQVKAWKAGFK